MIKITRALLAFAPQKMFQTKEEYVYETLRNAIMRCDIRPGEKLIIDTLSVELGVSQNPIRGALRRLQADKLIEIVPHTGAVVAEISPDTIEEIFVLLGSLESAAFETAADKVTEEDITQLRKLLEAMDTALAEGDSDRWSAINNQFHLAVAKITRMEMLLEFTGRALDSWDRLRRCYLKSVVSSRPAQAQAEHHQMVDLLAQRDTGHLIALLKEHNRNAMEAYQALLTD
jgi:DNA-binding GntR family transcriptional regulator